MNMKSRQMRLVVEFKEFQRLPDWRAIKLSAPELMAALAQQNAARLLAAREDGLRPRLTPQDSRSSSGDCRAHVE
jgi:hypothetical protein